MKIQKEIVKEQDLDYQFAKISLKIWADQLLYKAKSIKEQNL